MPRVLYHVKSRTAVSIAIPDVLDTIPTEHHDIG